LTGDGSWHNPAKNSLAELPTTLFSANNQMTGLRRAPRAALTFPRAGCKGWSTSQASGHRVSEQPFHAAWTADEAMSRPSETKAEALSRVEDCFHYIRLLLHERMMQSTDFVKVCQGHGFSNATVLQARKVLGVKAVRTSFARGSWGCPARFQKA
jgi:hypothetical protein